MSACQTLNLFLLHFAYCKVRFLLDDYLLFIVIQGFDAFRNSGKYLMYKFDVSGIK